jgi:hypothetical protein
VSASSDHRLLLLLGGCAYGAPLAALASGSAWSDEPIVRVLDRWKRGAAPPDAAARLGIAPADLLAWVRALGAELHQLATESDPLDLLEIGADERPPWGEVRDRYRRLSKESHPDRHPAEEHDRWAARQRALNVAWAALRDEGRFDEELEAHRRRGALRRHFGVSPALAGGAIVAGVNEGVGGSAGGGGATENAGAAGLFPRPDGRPFPLTARMAEDLFGPEELLPPPTRWERWRRRAGWAMLFGALAGGVALAIPSLMAPTDVLIPRLRPEPKIAPGATALSPAAPEPPPVATRQPRVAAEREQNPPPAAPVRTGDHKVDTDNRSEGPRRFGDQQMPTLDLRPAPTPAPPPSPTPAFSRPAPTDAGTASPHLAASSADPASAPSFADRRAQGNDRRAERALGDRLDDFLFRYTRAYEAEDAAALRALFDPAAIQNGTEPLDTIIENYSRLFAGADGVSCSMLRTGQRRPNEATVSGETDDRGGGQGNRASDDRAGGATGTDEERRDGEALPPSRLVAPPADLIVSATFQLEYVPTRRQTTAATRRLAGVMTIGLREDPSAPGGFRIVSLDW